jgi:hypothetical protein
MLAAPVSEPDAAVRAGERAVLKDEPATTVVLVGTGAAAEVHKTYRNRGLRWLQSWGRRSRAHREHDHLAALHAAGLPCLVPLGWSERRRLGGVDESTLRTRWQPDCAPLKQVLREQPPGGTVRPRAELARAMGALVAALHERGFLWCTPMPRNVLVVGAPAAADLLVCDTPASLHRDRDLRGGRLARIDLFLGAFSPSRRRDWTAPERLRWLLGYTAGDRRAARSLWRTMARRRPLQNVVERAFAMALFTYILGRPRSPARPPTPVR